MAVAGRHVLDINGALSFREVWVHHIYPVFQPMYDELKLLPSSRMTAKQTEREKKDKKEHKADVDIIHHKISSVLAEVRESGERRNTYMNITWTGPVDNTQLQTNITYEKVANLALDMFCDTSKAASAGGAAASSTAASAEGDGTETPSQPQPRLLHAMARRRAHPWKIQNLVERGYEIPICITDTAVVPELGKFKRLGKDCVANAV